MTNLVYTLRNDLTSDIYGNKMLVSPYLLRDAWIAFRAGSHISGVKETILENIRIVDLDLPV